MDRDPRHPRPHDDDLRTVGALAEPNRRALYDYVVGERGWVSREQAAEALGLGRGVTAHHLDRLADDGLLETDDQRLNDRRGPGAGRPARVYRRAGSELAVSLPPRRYELAALLLADAAERCRRGGGSMDGALDRVARDAGTAIGVESTQTGGPRPTSARARRAQLLEVLRAHGYEPEALDTGTTVLHNCPFHQLAQQHTELICGMNLALLQGLLVAIDHREVLAHLEPEAGYCCVRFRPASGSGGDPACWATLVCDECGAVSSEGHRAGCPATSTHP